MGLQGEKCASNKTDVWSGSLTMMKILVGDTAIKSAIKYVSCGYKRHCFIVLLFYIDSYMCVILMLMVLL